MIHPSAILYDITQENTYNVALWECCVYKKVNQLVWNNVSYTFVINIIWILFLNGLRDGTQRL